MEIGEYGRMFAVEADHFWYQTLHGHVLRLLQPTSLCSVLDAGCGTGMLARRLTDAGYAVTGLDLSPEALRLAKTRRLETLVEGSVNALPFPENSFDAIVSLDVWYHQAVDDALAACEAARVVKPGGIVIVNLPAYDWLRGHHDEVVQTARRYNRAQVKKLLTSSGLEVRFCSHWNTLLFPAIVAVRLLSRLRKESPRDSSSDVAPVAPWLNKTLSALLAAERPLLSLPLPYGLSILAVGRKPK
ncbi:class I SAM-dependent methyltransferase [Armatimonas sp.]|uniref:class I SAM-dependent methyltransferase n=1 Tax=Armatimonas sp. TaxID=1872638 RepID=UPI00375312B2